MSRGTKTLGLAALALATTALMLPAGASAAGNWQSCKSANGGNNGVAGVHVKRLRCNTAVKVARKAARRFVKKETDVTRFNNWKCRSVVVGNYTAEATCKRPDKKGRNQVARFVYEFIKE